MFKLSFVQHLKESVEGQSVDHDVHCEEQPVVDHLVVRCRRQPLCDFYVVENSKETFVCVCLCLNISFTC